VCVCLPTRDVSSYDRFAFVRPRKLHRRRRYVAWTLWRRFETAVLRITNEYLFRYHYSVASKTSVARVQSGCFVGRACSSRDVRVGDTTRDQNGTDKADNELGTRRREKTRAPPDRKTGLFFFFFLCDRVRFEGKPNRVCRRPRRRTPQTFP